MGSVTALRTGQESVTLGAAIGGYLRELDRPESRGTHRQYAATLARLERRLGADADLGAIPAADVTGWLEESFAGRTPATYNRAIDVMRGAWAWWILQGWASADPTAAMRRRTIAPDRSRALDRREIEQLLTREAIPLRERTLWRMLYETAARSAEVLALDVEDLDLANRRSRVIRKGGAVDVIVWQTGTARLLPRLLKGRRAGPLFLTDRKARVQLPPGDVDPASGRARLSYRQAEGLFREASGGATLHQLRHSALTHDAEDGASTPMLMAKSGHTSVRSLARYARPSAEALARWQADHDPARR